MKKLLAGILTVVMIATSMPIVASAQDLGEVSTVGVTNETQIEEKETIENETDKSETTEQTTEEITEEAQEETTEELEDIKDYIAETTENNDVDVSDVLETTPEDVDNSQNQTYADISVNIDFDTYSKIVLSTFPNIGESRGVNSIYISDLLKNQVDSVLKTSYNNEYCLYGNEIEINNSLILSSAENATLEDKTKYIFLGNDTNGNMLSVKLSDYINKENGLLKLMNSGYSSIIVSFEELQQNQIEMDYQQSFALMYYENQLVIAVNTEKCGQNTNESVSEFNYVVSTFLDLYKIEPIQPFGIVVGFPIVYSGPGKDGYSAVGSLNAFETYETIYKELGFQYIEYTLNNSTTRKRGYIDQYGGGSGTIPSIYSKGMGLKILKGCTVYSGPSTEYATVGSVGTDEKVTLLVSTMGYTFIEYSSSTGTKRGYIFTSFISAILNTSLGVTLNKIVVGDDYTVNAGSIFKNEYFVIIGKNDQFYKIEYNISSGRKIGYVRKDDVEVVNTSMAVPDVPNLLAFQAVPKGSTTVYGGADEAIYANIGSVNTADTVGVLGTEGSFYYIQYSTSSGAKRGYVQMASLNLFDGSSGLRPTGVETQSAYADAPTGACKIFACPNSSSANIGSVGAYEGITVFPGIKDNGFTFVEYSTSSKTKRGFISTDMLSGYNEGVKGRANDNLDVFYTASNTGLKLGSINKAEYVIILNTAGDFYYIEYNSPTGRKRGYTEKSITPHSSSGISEISTGIGPVEMNSAEKVYSGPSDSYANVGSVGLKENVTLIDKGTRGWYLINYSTSGGRKQGYVPKSSVSPSSASIHSEIKYPTYANSQIHVMEGYTSGLGRDLVYYTLGDENSDNVLFLNFAIHGHEDNVAQDGMGLVKMAFRTVQTLSMDNIVNANNWYVVIVPTFNPDGILTADGCNGLCQGVGRHNAVQMVRDASGNWVDYKATVDGNAMGHIDMNRCFPYDEAGNFAQNTVGRNYTGPKAMMAQEAVALSELIKQYKDKSGKKYFVDVHGWTQQIIVNIKDKEAPIAMAFKDNFGYKNIDATLGNPSANGYVAKYSKALGYQSCLFEFPGDTDPNDFYNKDYGNGFINAVQYLLNT